ncbi:MAG TPA: hypothetical protein DD979_06940, partial [Gammaproteobacteria bacterium]|nr:hypothetical protein [Gammaproteobacteria bacterium]
MNMRIFAIGKWSLNAAVLGLLMALQSMAAHGVAIDQGGYDGSADYFRVQRDQFQRAREALRERDEDAFRAAYQKIQSYPLRPYLDYLRTRQEIEANPGPDALGVIKDFRAKHQDSQWAAKLERALLSALAEQARWRDYLHAAAAVSVKPDQCAMLLARVKTQQLHVFDQASRQLWVRSREYPAHCGDAFATLSHHSPVTVAMVWERVYALMDKGRTEAMKEMLPYLSRRDRATIDAWIVAWPKPGRGLHASSMFAEDTGLNRRIVLNLVERWAKRDSAASYVFWQKVRDQYLFSPAHKHRIDALIARMAAYDDLEEAHHWLHALPDDDIDKRIRAWRIRTGLRLQDWQAVLRDIGSLPANERDDAQWRYWRARAAEQTGDHALARQLYGALATEQSYHGFLAAERIGEPYALRERATQAEQARMRRLALEPELIRAREYAHAGLAWEGRRLWMDAVAEMNLPDRYAAAALAARWHWADRAVFTVAKTGHKDALSLRFPMPHLDQVDAASDQHAIDASWIYGVMRRESG